jgi:hypothetical protein
MAFDGSEVKDNFKFGGAFRRLNGIHKMNNVHTVSVLTPSNYLRLLDVGCITAFDRFIPFVL